MQNKNFRQQSRDVQWETRNGANPTLEELNAGSLLRIADALELSAKDRERLERDYKIMRNSRDSWQGRAETAERRIAALKGVITKMKKAQK